MIPVMAASSGSPTVALILAVQLACRCRTLAEMEPSEPRFNA